MRKLIAIIALFVASEAGAQGLNPYPPGVKPKAKDTETTILSLAFSSAGCKDTGTDSVDISGGTRNSVATYVDADGNVQTCTATQYRVAPTDGLMTEASATNRIGSSDALTTGWSSSNVTLSTTGTNPIGGAWRVVQGNANDSEIYNYTTTGAGAGQKAVACVWARKSGADSNDTYMAVGTYKSNSITTCECYRSDGGTCTPDKTSDTNRCLARVANLSTTPVRVCAIAEYSAAGTLYIGLFPGNRGTSTGTTWFALADLTIGSLTPSSHITCASAPCTRNADAISITTPAVPSIPAKWSLGVTAKKYWAAPWASGTVFALDKATPDGKNESHLTMGAANLVWTVTDATPTSQTVTVTAPGYTAGSSHAYVLKNVSGVLSMTCDGANCGGAPTGTASFGTSPTILYLGQTSAGADQWNGYLNSITIKSNPK